MCGLDLAICMDRPGAVDEMTITEFRKELAAIAARSGVAANFRPCSTSAVVRLHLSEDGLNEEPSALGAARRRHGQIAPDLRIFVGPISRVVGTRLPYLLGLAMGRVAAHELGHYLRQDVHHESERGIMAEGLTGAELIVRHDFRIPLRAR